MIVDVVGKRAREVSYLPFTARIDFLRKRFGLRVDLSEEIVTALEHYSTLRNTVVHDQGVFSLGLDDGYRITLDGERCPLHPNPVSSEEYSRAAAAFLATAQVVHGCVITQVLKAEDDGPFRPLLQGVIDAILPASTAPVPPTFGTVRRINPKSDPPAAPE
jgi:hypothetical protein